MAFKSSFEEYLLSRIQDGVDLHEKYNPCYRRMKEKHKNFYELADEIIEGLPHDDRETMMDLVEMDFYIQAEEDMVIYIQEIKDCVNILKYLGVL